MNALPQESEHNNPPVMKRLLGLTIGPLPLPLFIILFLLVYLASIAGKLPSDMIGGFAVLLLLSWLLKDAGMNVPVLKDIGGPAILCVFLPSIMVFYNVINPPALKAATALIKDANFLYMAIAILVSGSILGMPRKVLVQGFLRMFIPLTVGTLTAIAAGVGVGLLVGYAPYQTFFFIVIPILGGGIGEGIIPYSIAMSEILGQPQSTYIPQLVPAAMVGNIVAVIGAGYLKRFGEKHPRYNGSGLLVRTGDDKELLAEISNEKKVDYKLMGAGLALASGFFILGTLLSKYIGIPGPIIMIFAAALVKVFRLLPAEMELGAYQMYRFLVTSLMWAVLVGLGILYTPWKDVVGVLTDPGYILICASTVVTMILSGFYIGKVMKMYEVEAAIVTCCHSGLGGTGDVAILSAADRMSLMPFAQISTRIGGALTIVIATILLKIFS